MESLGQSIDGGVGVEGPVPDAGVQHVLQDLQGEGVAVATELVAAPYALQSLPFRMGKAVPGVAAQRFLHER